MSEFPILYPGSFESGELIPVDLTSDPPATYFPTGDQVDCSDPDPQPFESYFGPWLEIIADVVVVYPPSSGGQDPSLAIFYPSVMDAPFIQDTLIYDLADDYDTAQVPNEPDPPSFEFYFEPWTDLSFTIIWDGSLDVPAAPPDPDLDPVVEFSFEPWTDIIVLVWDLSLEYDTAQPANEPDPPEFEFSFIVVDVDLFEASTPFPTGDQWNDERDPDTFDYSFDHSMYVYVGIPVATETVTAFFIF